MRAGPISGFGWRKWAALLGYGLLIELLQSQIPNRFLSLADLLANAVGHRRLCPADPANAAQDTPALSRTADASAENR